MSDGAAYLLDVLAERGLRLVLKADGSPSLRGGASEVTPALRGMLAEYRDELVAVAEPCEHAQPPAFAPPGPSAIMPEWREGAPAQQAESAPVMEWLHRDGQILTGGDWPPQACYWRRPPGGAAWSPIPGRTPLCALQLEGDTYGCEERKCPGCVAAGIAREWDGAGRSPPIPGRDTPPLPEGRREMKWGGRDAVV